MKKAVRPIWDFGSIMYKTGLLHIPELIIRSGLEIPNEIKLSIQFEHNNITRDFQLLMLLPKVVDLQLKDV